MVTMYKLQPQLLLDPKSATSAFLEDVLESFVQDYFFDAYLPAAGIFLNPNAVLAEQSMTDQLMTKTAAKHLDFWLTPVDILDECFQCGYPVLLIVGRTCGPRNENGVKFRNITWIFAFDDVEVFRNDFEIWIIFACLIAQELMEDLAICVYAVLIHGRDGGISIEHADPERWRHSEIKSARVHSKGNNKRVGCTFCPLRTSATARLCC
jgi:hypothetical protein